MPFLQSLCLSRNPVPIDDNIPSPKARVDALPGRQALLEQPPGHSPEVDRGLWLQNLVYPVDKEDGTEEIE